MKVYFFILFNLLVLSACNIEKNYWYKTNVLKSQGYINKNGNRVGKWYYYHENGKLNNITWHLPKYLIDTASYVEPHTLEQIDNYYKNYLVRNKIIAFDTMGIKLGYEYIKKGEKYYKVFRQNWIGSNIK